MNSALNPAGRRLHVLIVGGGASGVLMAAMLLARAGGQLRVTLVERGPLLGRGLAYATDRPEHLLNTPAAMMSAWPDRPDDFVAWLRANGTPDAKGTHFADRGSYGRYLAQLLVPWRGDPGRLRCLRGEVVRIDEDAGGVIARLGDGGAILADAAVLATGHAVAADPGGLLRPAWDFGPPADPEARVAIIGTGLSMVDHLVTLTAQGHRGPITAFSRRGLLPLCHGPAPVPGPGIAVAPADLPFGASLAGWLGWLRARARAAEAGGGSWHDAVDAVRPHVARIWASLPLSERARFLRHGASWWEIHRHRMPPASARIVAEARGTGRLRVLRAGLGQVEAGPGGTIRIGIVPRGADVPRTLEVDHLIDCRGIRRDPAREGAALIRDMLGRGIGRLDPLGLGLSTDAEARVIGADGRTSGRIHAIGPMARGALWEITAIPDIRAQAAALAGRLAAAPQRVEATGESRLELRS